MFNKKLFSQRLTMLLEEHRINDPTLASAIGVSKQAINQLRKERSVPSIDSLIAIADYFNISLDYLAGRSDNPRRY